MKKTGVILILVFCLFSFNSFADENPFPKISIRGEKLFAGDGLSIILLLL